MLANLSYYSKAIALIVVLPILGFYGCGLSKLFSDQRTQIERPKSVIGYFGTQELEAGRKQELAWHNREALNQYVNEEAFYRSHTQDRRPRNCLALSGGGMRSALFSIGVLKALHEKKLLQRVDVISAVSGGAYAAAWYLVQQLDDGVPPTEDAYWEAHVKQLSSVADKIKKYSLYSPEMALLSAPFNVIRHAVADITDVNWQWLRKNSFTSLYGLALRDSYFYRLSGGERNPSLQEMEEILRRQHGPLFVINATNATSSVLLENKVFEITPYHKGSNALGYHVVGEQESLDSLKRLVEAMALSGAAFDSEAYGGVKKWVLKALSLGLGEYVMWKNDKDSDEGFIFLTDGGHSENLGVYSLTRRLCENITVIDAEFDPSYDFEGYVLLKCALKREMGVDLKVEDIDKILKPTQDLSDRVGECRDLIDAENRRQGVYDTSKPIMAGTIGIFPLMQPNGEIDVRPIELKYIKLSIDESKLGIPDREVGHAGAEMLWYGDDVARVYADAQLELKKKWCVPDRWVTSQAFFPQRTTIDQFYSKELAKAYISLGFSTVDHYWDNADKPRNMRAK